MSVTPTSSQVVTVTVNGHTYEHEVPARRLLVHFLRDDLSLTGTHIGCDTGSCGACTVHLDGEPTRSCRLPISTIAGRKVTTIEGLSPDRSHALQRAFVTEQVPQCGYCQTGMIMSVAALLDVAPNPTDAQINDAISNICRCGTYGRIRAAIHLAAGGPGQTG